MHGVHVYRTPELACAADEDEAVSGTGASLQSVPERCAYLSLMRAYASDAWSAQQASLQLRDNRGYDGYKQLTWHAAFRRLALVHVLFKNFPDDSSTELPVATQVRSGTWDAIHNMCKGWNTTCDHRPEEDTVLTIPFSGALLAVGLPARSLL